MTGADPKTSVVNRYLQSWDADNLFVMGASVFPQNASYNPTDWWARWRTTRRTRSPRNISRPGSADARVSVPTPKTGQVLIVAAEAAPE